MKKIVYIILGASLLFCACSGSDKAATVKMADEMCQAMALITDDPMSTIEAASKMSAIAEKTVEYGKVSQEDLISAMKEKCPEGAAKFEEMATKK